jgi:DNA repair exonuclease SbcCD nuclease subunit
MIPDRISEDDHVFHTGQVENSGMDYIALGHWHRNYELPSTRVCAWYSGSPEWLSTDQKDTGNVLLVEMPDSGKAKVTPLKTGCRQFEEVEIDLSGDTDALAVKQRIASGANPNLIRHVVLKGLRSLNAQLDVEEWQSEFANRFFFLKIIDTSHPELQQVIDEHYPEGSVIRRFINLMQQEIGQQEGKEREIAEKALQYGVALLMGKGVLE